MKLDISQRSAKVWRFTAHLLLIIVLTQAWFAVSGESVAVQRLNEARRIASQREDTLQGIRQNLRREVNELEVDLMSCEGRWTAADLPTALCSQQAADIDDARILAERNFKTCLSANAGLLDSLREFDALSKKQKQVIEDALVLARRCDAQPAKWTLVWPTESEVRW